MKQLKYLLLLWLLPLIASANYVHWLGDYNKALHLAQKEHKPLLVLVVKKDSKQCNIVIKDQFMDHPYVKSINKKMVSVMVTYEGALSYPIEMYYTTTFPTLFFVDSQKELFSREPLYGNEINSKILSEIMKVF
jgi:thioredoxin-related protein